MFNHVEEFPSIRVTDVLKYGAIATAIVLVSVLGYILLNPVPPGPVGEVMDIKTYVPHTPPPDADGQIVLTDDQQPKDSVLVLTPVKIQNKGKKPFSIFDLTGVVRFPNAEYESADVSTEDFPKIFQYYPDLLAYQQAPLLRQTMIKPGETKQGLLIFDYPLTQDQWELRTSFEVKASFDHGGDIVLSGGDTSESWPRMDAQAQ